MSYTKGPWKRQEGYETFHLVTSGDDEYVAQIDNDAAEADVALMIAAPELLEALKFCRSVLLKNGLFELSEKLALSEADAAIAKATGEQP